MKSGFALAVSTLVLTACGQSTPTPQALNVAGGWTGSFTFNGNTFAPYQMELSQKPGADDFTGVIYYQGDRVLVAGKTSTGVMYGSAGDNNPITYTGRFTPTTYRGVAFTKATNFSFNLIKDQ